FIHRPSAHLLGAPQLFAIEEKLDERSIRQTPVPLDSRTGWIELSSSTRGASRASAWIEFLVGTHQCAQYLPVVLGEEKALMKLDQRFLVPSLPSMQGRDLYMRVDAERLQVEQIPPGAHGVLVSP